MKQILFLAYYFSDSDGVGSIRSRSLYNYLLEKGISIELLSNLEVKSLLKWTLRSVRKICTTKSETVYLSLGPFTPIVFISVFCFLCRKKLILDYRDPWSFNIMTGYKGDKAKATFSSYIAVLIEKLSALAAVEVWVCTEGMFQYYKNLLPAGTSLRMIPNGYIGDLLEVSPEKYPETTFVCVGKFAEYNFEKSKLILQQVARHYPKAKVLLVGSDRKINAKVIEEIKFPLDITVLQRLNQAEMEQILSKAHFGLILLRDENIDVGTKVYDYIKAGVTIFDCFDHSSLFYEKFQNYISTQKLDIDVTLRRRYSRQNIWETAAKESHFQKI